MNLNFNTPSAINNPFSSLELSGETECFATEAWQLDVNSIHQHWSELARRFSTAINPLLSKDSEFSTRGSNSIYVKAVKVSKMSYDEISEQIVPVPDGLTSPYIWSAAAAKQFEKLSMLEVLETVSASFRKMLIMLSGNDSSVENFVKESLLNVGRIKKEFYQIPLANVGNPTNVEITFAQQFKSSRDILEAYASLMKLDKQLSHSKNVKKAIDGLAMDIESISKLIDGESGTLTIELSPKFRPAFAEYVRTLSEITTYYGHTLLTIMACQHNFTLTVESLT